MSRPKHRQRIIDQGSDDQSEDVFLYNQEPGPTELSTWIYVEKVSRQDRDGSDEDNNRQGNIISPSVEPAPQSLHSTLHGERLDNSSSALSESDVSIDRDHEVPHVARHNIDAARAQTENERERHIECCHLVEFTMNRLRAMCQEPSASVENLESLRQQLSLDTDMVTEQFRALKEAEAAMVSLENASTCNTTIGDSAAARSKTGTSSWGRCYKDPPMVERYFRRAGDASIAGQRIAELDYWMAVQERQYCVTSGASIAQTELMCSEQVRREKLQSDLDCALRDAEVLKAECVARGLDIERARYS